MSRLRADASLSSARAVVRATDVPTLSDQALRTLLASDSSRGWRAFIDDYTALLLALIDRAGITSRDEAMEVYVRVCEHLADDDCARLRRHDPAKGPLAAWLAVVVRNVIVDWIRSRAGRRRLFGAVRGLGSTDQRVFELYYWEDRTPAEIAEMIASERGGPIGLADVLEGLDRIHAVLTERHRSELLSMAVRSRAMASLEQELEAGTEVRDESAGPEHQLVARETADQFAAALAALPAEDAAIVRLRYVQGLSLGEIRRALHLDRLPQDRVVAIVAKLRERLTPVGAREQ